MLVYKVCIETYIKTLKNGYSSLLDEKQSKTRYSILWAVKILIKLWMTLYLECHQKITNEIFFSCYKTNKEIHEIK